MNPTNLAKLIGLVAACVLIIYNVIMVMNTTENDTLGDVVERLIVERPLIPFMAGVVYGHLFWYT